MILQLQMSSCSAHAARGRCCSCPFRTMKTRRICGQAKGQRGYWQYTVELLPIPHVVKPAIFEQSNA